MKKTIILLLALSLLISCKKKDDTSSEQNNAYKAAVTFVSGNAEVYKDNLQDKKPIQMGDLLDESHTIITGDRSKIELSLKDNSKILIKANSQLNIQKLISDKNNDMSFFLKKGLVIVKLQKKDVKGKYEIATPTAVASARGTRFLVQVGDKSANGKPKTTVAVETGKVALIKYGEGEKASEPIEEKIIEPNEQLEVTEEGIVTPKVEMEPIIVKEFIENVSKPDNLEFTGSILTEDGLFKKYKKLEVITLDNKTELKGVIIESDENNMIIHTVKGMVKIDTSHVVDQKTIK
ncbi:MAG: FecR domain-containing protein [Leptospiraceae bacterium]|nr:FecR domain-containing protein [Leptospiraceae bacterium]MCP5497411.1 FecR domain-containing protein [Leptospiraceae bacterium]